MSIQNIDRAVYHLRQAHAVIILTGAGISKESGIPTYREPQTGIWAKYNPQELSTPEGFTQNPKLVWDWHEHLRQSMVKAEPNPGHRAITELQRLLPNVGVITQNIDGLHQRADTTGVIELHGNIHKYKCSRNCRGNPTRMMLDLIHKYSPEGIPVCSYCGAYIRHDIVWFHESLNHEVISRAWALVDDADVLISIGTSGIVWPAAGLPLRAKESNHAYLIDVNPGFSELSGQADLHLAAPAGEALPALVQALREAQS